MTIGRNRALRLGRRLPRHSAPPRSKPADRGCSDPAPTRQGLTPLDGAGVLRSGRTYTDDHVAPEETPYFDRRLPCQAHDYCADLTRFGILSRGEDRQCDSAFKKLMEADCAWRDTVSQAVCNDSINTLYGFVLLHKPSLEVGRTRLRNIGNSMCITVSQREAGRSTVTAGSCDPATVGQQHYLANIRIRIHLAGGARRFTLRPARTAQRQNDETFCLAVVTLSRGAGVSEEACSLIVSNTDPNVLATVREDHAVFRLVESTGDRYLIQFEQPLLEVDESSNETQVAMCVVPDQVSDGAVVVVRGLVVKECDRSSNLPTVDY